MGAEVPSSPHLQVTKVLRFHSEPSNAGPSQSGVQQDNRDRETETESQHEGDSPLQQRKYSVKSQGLKAS